MRMRWMQTSEVYIQVMEGFPKPEPCFARIKLLPQQVERQVSARSRMSSNHNGDSPVTQSRGLSEEKVEE